MFDRKICLLQLSDIFMGLAIFSSGASESYLDGLKIL